MKQLKITKKVDFLKPLSVALFASLSSVSIVSCSSGSGVRLGPTVAPTSVESVKVTTRYPKKYTSLGLVESTAEHPFRSGNTVAKNALLELREQAAQLGADTVVVRHLIADDDSSHSTSTIGDGFSIGLGIGGGLKRMSGEAILSD